ncbi:MAG: hypothetical protein MEQ07_09725 [Aquimonas sp.]|nr:hypothetical protein [Aquimonas sp.]
MGNLLRRSDFAGSRNQVERFEYDARNRLLNTFASQNGGPEVLRQSQTYDVSGNILRKSDVGSYQVPDEYIPAWRSSDGRTKAGSFRDRIHAGHVIF